MNVAFPWIIFNRIFVLQEKYERCTDQWNRIASQTVSSEKVGRKLSGLSGCVVCIEVEDGVGVVGIWRFGFLFGFYDERKKQLVSDNFFEVGYSMLPPFQCLRGLWTK